MPSSLVTAAAREHQADRTITGRRTGLSVPKAPGFRYRKPVTSAYFRARNHAWFRARNRARRLLLHVRDGLRALGEDADPRARAGLVHRLGDGGRDVLGLLQVRLGELSVAEVVGVHDDAVRGLDPRLDLHLPLVGHGLLAGGDELQQRLR